MRNSKTLLLLEQLLQQGNKLGLGVYTNSKIIKDILEKEYGFPCTLISLKPDKEHQVVNTKLLILDQVEKYYDHKPTPKELNLDGKKFNKVTYWKLYDTKAEVK